MGGDNNPAEVQQLADYLRQQHVSQVKVGWYSGKSNIPEDINEESFQYIKTGPYVEELGGLKSKETNQRLYKIEGTQIYDITYRFWKK